MKAVIVAGGKGERLKPLTEEIPKPMVKIIGKPILEHLIYFLKRNGIDEIIITLQYLPDVVKEYFGDGSKFGVKIIYFIEKEPLGTAGALKNIKDSIDDTFVVLYGDNLANFDLKAMIDFHKNRKNVATIALHKKKIEERSSSYVSLGEDGKIEKFIERPSEEDFRKIKTGYITVNAGIYILNQEILNYIPGGKFDFSYDLFPLLLEGGLPLFGLPIDGYYREIGTLEKFNKALAEIERGEVKELKSDGTKAVFLDRDGVINEIIYDEDIGLLSPRCLEEFRLLPDVKKSIAELKKKGFKIVVVANQPGLVMGHFTKEALDNITKKMIDDLKLDAVYYCLHHPKFTGDCNCRKPKNGLILKAASEMNINLSKSYAAGDRVGDIEAGSNSNVKATFFVGDWRCDVCRIFKERKVKVPTFIVENLAGVARGIINIEEGGVKNEFAD